MYLSDMEVFGLQDNNFYSERFGKNETIKSGNFMQGSHLVTFSDITLE